MKKKVVAISILAVFMIVAISYATAVNTTNVEKKESPLFGIRTRRAINEKITDIIENIRTKFLGGRMFFMPLIRFRTDTPRVPMFKVNTNFEECTWYPSMCNGPWGCVSYYYPDECTYHPGDKMCVTNNIVCSGKD
jgi:hypothetical protein